MTNIMSSQTFVLPSAPKFNSLPSFLKAGFINYFKYQNVRNQNFSQRMAVCELLKTKANNLFLDSKFDKAITEYEQALSIYRYVIGPSFLKIHTGIQDGDLEFIDFTSPKKEEEIQIQNLKIALYNNLAACYLKLKDFSNAISACNEVLFLDPKKVKALYRRAKAIISKSNPGIEDYKAAKRDLKLAYSLDSKDSVIEQLYVKVNNELSKLEGGLKGFLQRPPSSKTQEEKQEPAGVEIKTPPKVLNEKTNIDPKPQVIQIEEPRANKDFRTWKPSAESQNKVKQEKHEGKHGATCSPPKDKIEDSSEKPDLLSAWDNFQQKMDQSSLDYVYMLSFEQHPNGKVPPEVEEFGKLLEKRGKEAIIKYEKAGRKNEIEALKENLNKAHVYRASFKRIEMIAKLDPNRPSAELKKRAAELKAKNPRIGIEDFGFQEQLKLLQEKNVNDVKEWLLSCTKGNTARTAEKKREQEKKKQRKGFSSTTYETSQGGAGPHITTINNYFINNNYFGGSGFFSKLFSSSSSHSNLITTVREKREPSLKAAFKGGVTAKEFEAILDKWIVFIKFVLFCLLTLMCLYLMSIKH